MIQNKSLLQEIKISKQQNSLTEKLKLIFYNLITNLLKSSRFKNYDQDTRDEMAFKAYEF